MIVFMYNYWIFLLEIVVMVFLLIENEIIMYEFFVFWYFYVFVDWCILINRYILYIFVYIIGNVC